MAQLEMVDGKCGTAMGQGAGAADLRLAQLEVVDAQLVDGSIGGIDRALGAGKAGRIVANKKIVE